MLTPRRDRQHQRAIDVGGVSAMSRRLGLQSRSAGRSA
jgi:hypothetical protein